MVVLETGSEPVNGSEGAYFVGALIEGDEPRDGQMLDFVRVTNLFDEQRSGALYLTASDTDSPYMDVVDGAAREFSLCYPPIGGENGTPAQSYFFSFGSAHVTGSYKERVGDVSRVYRLDRTDAEESDTDSYGLKVDLGGPVSDSQVILVSFKVRSSVPIGAAGVKFGYRDDSNCDYADTVSVGTEWEYKLLALTLEFPAEYPRSFTVDLTGKISAGEWFEVAELNIIRLSDLSAFGKATKARVGKITGVVDPVFGKLDGYGAYFQNLYATRNVNIAGTLTAGDGRGFSSTFYVGRIHKNVIPNSITPEFLDTPPTLTEDVPPAGVGSAYRIGATTKMVLQSAEWCRKHLGETYCLSIWMKSSKQGALFLYTNSTFVAFLTVRASDGWRRHYGTFRVMDPGTSPLYMSMYSFRDPVTICSPQLEQGATPSQYQPTDGTLSYVDDYGAWFSRGGIGGTIQNPLLRLNADGSISSRDGSFVINADGTGHFAEGRFRWNKDTISLSDFTIRWEDLSESARENLKGETGDPGVDANLMDWVSEWNSSKTVIDGSSVITPKIFVGTRNTNGTITGIALGRFPLLVRNDAGDLQSQTIDGVYGFREGVKTFGIDTRGNVEIGRGGQSIRYNAETGSIEFGAAVAMHWAGVTYIDSGGIFTGRLSASVIEGIAIDARQITAGTIDTQRLNVAALKAQLLTAAGIEALTLSVVRGRIGCWSIDGDSLFSGTKNNSAGQFTTAAGSVTMGSGGIRGSKWRLDSSGAGAIAGGNISWDSAGNVTFAPSVSIQWTDKFDWLCEYTMDEILPRLTQIDSDGIYTGTLTAEQINAVDIDASSIKTGFLSAERIAAGSITADRVNATDLQTSLITTNYIEGLSLNFARGAIGGWVINLDSITSQDGSVVLDSAGRRIAVLGNGATTTSGARVMLYYSSLLQYGLQVSSPSNKTLVHLGSINHIVRWWIESDAIRKNNVYLGADGSIYNGTKWKLGNDGSGELASGNIRWDADGNVTFSNSVSLNWTEPMEWLWGYSVDEVFPRLTQIDSEGVYTGTLTAEQVNAVEIDAGSITTGYLSSDRILAGSITADKVNVRSLQASIITTGYLEGLSLSFGKGTIGGWVIGESGISSPNGKLLLDSAGSKIAIYADPSSPNGARVMLHCSGVWSYGLQVFNASNNLIVTLGFFNRIAGWSLTPTTISKNDVTLGADGSIYNGSKWKLGNDGSGELASGNISWDKTGKVIFSEAVSLSWKAPIDTITGALGGATFDRLTHIGVTGIYTGTISASQIMVDSTLVVGGSSHNGSISVRDASGSVKVTLDRSGIAAVGGKIGGWNLTSYSLYSGNVYLSSSGNIYNGTYWKLASDGSGQLASSRISWTSAGVLTVKNAILQDAVVRGTIRSPFVMVDGSIVIVIGGGGSAEAIRPDSEKYDNLCVIAGESEEGARMAPPKLPWSVDQSGRRLVLTHYRYDNEYCYGTCTFEAPSGKYFYEYGRESKTLNISRETVELMGYGSRTQFYGWIVLNRRDLLTTSRYGTYGQYLAMGSVVCKYSNYAPYKYKTYDGSTLTVNKTGRGRYTVWLPWVLGADSYMVMLSGRLSPVENTSIYATVMEQYDSSFVVQTHDDATLNEGSFNFVVISTADFVSK